jgi:hypothetical protein
MLTPLCADSTTGWVWIYAKSLPGAAHLDSPALVDSEAGREDSEAGREDSEVDPEDREVDLEDREVGLEGLNRTSRRLARLAMRRRDRPE